MGSYATHCKATLISKEEGVAFVIMINNVIMMIITNTINKDHDNQQPHPDDQPYPDHLVLQLAVCFPLPAPLACLPTPPSDFPTGTRLAQIEI